MYIALRDDTAELWKKNIPGSSYPMGSSLRRVCGTSFGERFQIILKIGLTAQSLHGAEL
jgi:hypothetical protein